MYKTIFLLSFLALGAPIKGTLDKATTNITILGTSTLHDWEMQSEDFYSTGTVMFDGSNITSTDYTVYFPTEKLESGKETMNGYAQEALDADNHQNIIFALKSVVNEGASAKAVGSLTIAGSTKNVSIPVSIEINDNKAIIKGKTKINMPAYNVEPPSVMFGTIVCGDDVDVEFQFAFNLNNK